MLTKVTESKNLQQKLRNVQERLKSTSNEFDDYDDAVDCRIELEMEELEYKKEECDQDINKLYKRLEEERQQYIDILRYECNHRLFSINSIVFTPTFSSSFMPTINGKHDTFLCFSSSS